MGGRPGVSEAPHTAGTGQTLAVKSTMSASQKDHQLFLPQEVPELVTQMVSKACVNSRSATQNLKGRHIVFTRRSSSIFWPKQICRYCLWAASRSGLYDHMDQALCGEESL